MTTTSAVLYTALAGSFGWGMRGALIGGEKGAMLPGALLGVCLAFISGEPLAAQNYVLFAAVGALGMGFGGFEPYGQTMSMIIDRSKGERNPVKGYTGLALKGALWFGIAAAFLGMAFSGMTGEVYRWYDIVLVAAPIPLVQYFGVKIFNSPYDPEKGVFPGIYFSYERREEWGGNLLMLILLVVMMIVRGDVFSLILTASGAVAGAVGWHIGIYLMDVTMHPLKRGGFILGKLQTGGFVDNWKIMEFALGAVGAGVTAAVFGRIFPRFVQPLYAERRLWNVLGERADIAAWVAFALMALTLLQYTVIYFRSRSPEGRGLDDRALELLERPFILSIPLGLCLLGNTLTALLTVSFELYFVAAQKAIFESWANYRGRWALTFLTALAGAGVLFVVIFNPKTFTSSPTFLIVFQCALYEALELTCALRPSHISREIRAGRRAAAFGSKLSVHAFFILQIVLLILGAGRMFAS